MPPPRAEPEAELAIARGQAALQAGERQDALRWFDRAHRLAPRDSLTVLLLAGALAGLDDARARGLLRTLLVAHPRFREGRLALVAAELRLGAAEAAARTLDAALRDAAPPDTPGFHALAGQVVAAAGAPGWIGVWSGRLVLSHPDAVPCVDDVLLRGSGIARSLPRGRVVGRLTAQRGGRALLGSGVELASRHTVEGFVTLGEAGLDGWAWLPGDPDATPVVTLRDAADAVLLRLQGGEVLGEAAEGGTARRRALRLPAARLPPGPVLRALGPDGRELLGSPLHPVAEGAAAWAAAAALRGLHPAPGSPGPGEASLPDPWRPLLVTLAPAARRWPEGAPWPVPRRGVDVVVPVHRGAADFIACVESVRRSPAAGARLVVVDDASPDPALREAVEAAAARGEVVLLRHPRGLGFPAAANTGLRHACLHVAGPRDVVLLNPDTVLPPGWLERLAKAAYAAPDIGSVTPLTGDGSILSYPHPDAPDPPAIDADPDAPVLTDNLSGLQVTERLDALARTANGTGLVDLPTGIGFCLFIRHDCLAEVGLLREDAFAQGYGEENDWCLRARQLGWRHVAATGVFVTHLGGRSFGAGRQALLARNLAVLNRLHPGYDALVQRFLAADPLAPARRRMDLVRWAQGRRARSMVLLTHGHGGGVERHLRERCEALRRAGLRAIVLRPAPAGALPSTAEDRICAVSDGAEDGFPNLRFRLPLQRTALVALLRAERPLRVEVHHLLGHAPEVASLAAALDVPYDVVVHDYALWCPRVSLCSHAQHYCGEPQEVTTCEACVADLGSRIGEDIGVAALRRRSAALLGDARQVVVACADVHARIARQFPGVVPVVTPWEEPPGRAATPLSHPPAGGLRVVVCGAIGVEKGYHVLLACARDAVARALPLDFVLAGHSMDDVRLAAASVFVTGAFEEAEAVALVRAQGGQLGFVPSVWPETWCYALSTLWQAGLPVIAFDLGAQAERIDRSGQGTLLPLGMGARQINDALLGLRHICG